MEPVSSVVKKLTIRICTFEQRRDQNGEAQRRFREKKNVESRKLANELKGTQKELDRLKKADSVVRSQMEDLEGWFEDLEMEM